MNQYVLVDLWYVLVYANETMVYTSIYQYIPLRSGYFAAGFRGAHRDPASREVVQPSLNSDNLRATAWWEGSMCMPRRRGIFLSIWCRYSLVFFSTFEELDSICTEYILLYTSIYYIPVYTSIMMSRYNSWPMHCIQVYTSAQKFMKFWFQDTMKCVWNVHPCRFKHQNDLETSKKYEKID
jgi:hypothetical protein